MMMSGFGYDAVDLCDIYHKKIYVMFSFISMQQQWKKSTAIIAYLILSRPRLNGRVETAGG